MQAAQFEEPHQDASCSGAAPHYAPEATVEACGRSLKIPDHCSGLIDIQRLLQKELDMQNQTFEITDALGTRMGLDSEVRDAIAARRTPFSAALSDASIHFIENRREELAQMQWKVVRDQHNQASLKLTALGQQVRSLSQQLDTQRQELDLGMERLSRELQVAVDSAKDAGKNDQRQLSEGLSGVQQLVQSERSMREVAVEQMHKNLHNLRDSLEGERSNMQQGNSEAMRHAEGTRKLVEMERFARDALEDKMGKELQAVLDRVDSSCNALRARMDEHVKEFERMACASADANRVQDRKLSQLRVESDSNLSQLRSDSEKSLETMTVQLRILEDRCSKFENRLGESHRDHGESIEVVSKQAGNLLRSVEQMRCEGADHTQNVRSLAGSLKQLETCVNSVEADFAEACEREKVQRQQDFMNMQETIASEQNTLRSELERRILSMCENLLRSNVVPPSKVDRQLTFGNAQIVAEEPTSHRRGVPSPDRRSPRASTPLGCSPLRHTTPPHAPVLRQSVSLSASMAHMSLAKARNGNDPYFPAGGSVVVPGAVVYPGAVAAKSVSAVNLAPTHLAPKQCYTSAADSLLSSSFMGQLRA